MTNSTDLHTAQDNLGSDKPALGWSREKLKSCPPQAATPHHHQPSFRVIQPACRAQAWKGCTGSMVLGTTSINCKRDTEESQEHVCACRFDLIISLIWQFIPKASGKILKKKRLLQMILDLRFVFVPKKGHVY